VGGLMRTAVEQRLFVRSVGSLARLCAVESLDFSQNGITSAVLPLVDQAKHPACRPEAPRLPERPAIACRTISFRPQLHIGVCPDSILRPDLLIDAALTQIRGVGCSDLKRWRLLFGGIKSSTVWNRRPVKISAEREMYSQRND